MKKISYILFLCYFFCMAGLCGGETDKLWTIEDCVDYALSNSPAVKSSLENLNSTRYQNYVLKSEFFPKIFSNYSYTENSKITFGAMISPSLYADYPPSIYSTDFYTLNLGVSDTLFSWKMSPTFKLSKANVKIAGLKHNRVKNETVYSAKKSFYSVLFASETYRINLAAESVARENYETAQALYNEGKASSFDVSRAKVRWTNSKADLISSRNMFEVAIEFLKTVLSLPADENPHIEGTFADAPFNAGLVEVISQAKKHRPEVLESTEFLNLKKASFDISKSGFLPSVSGSFNYSWSSPDFNMDISGQYASWTAQVILSIPVFDGMFTIGRYKTSKSEKKMADFQKETVEDAVVMETRQAYYSMKNAMESLQAQKENVETAKENLNIARQRYGMGLLSHLELKDAELTMISAEIQHIKTLHDYNIAVVSLERAIGLPYR